MIAVAAAMEAPAVVCLVRPERLDGLLDAAFTVVARHIGVVSVTDCEVLRAERFWCPTVRSGNER